MKITLEEVQQRIADFMDCAGQGPEQAGPHMPPAPVVLRRLHMLHEEVRELEDAYRNNDIVEVADAIADIIVITLGAAVESDIKTNPVMVEVLRSNDTKINWRDGEPWASRADGKVEKDEHFDPAHIGPIINRQIKGNN